MSTEVVEGHDGRLWIIKGTPGHYLVCPVGDPIATYDRKFAARHDIQHRVGLLAKEDPPASTRDGSMTAEVLALVPALRGQLGEWFRIGEFAGQSTAGTIAKKLREAHPGKIETRPVREKEGGSVLYARWVGSRGGDR